MVDFEFGDACSWVLGIWGAWDEWSMVIRLFLSLGRSWKSFG